MATVIDVVIQVSKDLLDKIKGVQSQNVEKYKESKDVKKEEKKAVIEAQIIQKKEKTSSGVNEKAPRDETFAKRRGVGKYIDVSVVDETDAYSYTVEFDPLNSGQALLNAHWTTYRDNNPDVYFILLQPITPEEGYSAIPLPTEWSTWQDDPSLPAKEFFRNVSRPGDTGVRTDWKVLIEGLVGTFNVNDKIRFNIDNSGSMNLGTVYLDYFELTEYLDENGITYELFYMTNEEYLNDLRPSAKDYFETLS